MALALKKSYIALITFLAVAIVITTGLIVYLKLTPHKTKEFTEFYVLNAEGRALDYPEKVTVGSPIDVILGVVNHEYQPASYRIDIKIDGNDAQQINVGTLADKQKWEQKVSFTPKVVGERQMVDFILYKDGTTEPHLKEPLRLYIDVTAN
jgi:uncharacterized membrane protein